jgi:NAD-dependent deacetylase
MSITTQIDLAKYRNIVVLTGAGISAGSGLQTYRGPDGVWEKHNVEEYGHADTLRTNPQKTWELFGGMRIPINIAKPNPAHYALAKIEANLSSNQNFLLITQNVDGLHQKAGSKNVIEIHGNLNMTKCTNESCELEPFADTEPQTDSLPKCPKCNSLLRPDIVLFGEPLPTLASWQITRWLRSVDLFLAIGTSGTVYPASNYVSSAKYVGARTVLINLEKMNPPNPAFEDEYIGKAEEVLPKLFNMTV